jgi:chemotaxis protein MotB
VVGDRFVFQSELLFDTASAELGPAGREQVRRLVATLNEVAPKIPDDIEWVLQIDGHTDRRPIHTGEFPSNWELSTARALAIVKYAIELGVPPRRLAANGFAEFHPLDPGSDERAFAKNRRIEVKLTSR